MMEIQNKSQVEWEKLREILENIAILNTSSKIWIVDNLNINDSIFDFGINVRQGLNEIKNK